MAEPVGLALGALPLILTRLAKIKQPFGGKAVQDIRTQLEFQRVLLQNTLEVLLHGTYSEAEVSELLSDPRSPEWRSGRVESALRDSLGDDVYPSFVGLITEIFEVVSSLENSLREIDELHLTRSNLRRAFKSSADPKLPTAHLEKFRILNENLQVLVRSANASTSLQTRHVIGNLGKSLEAFYGIQQTAQNIENFAAATLSGSQDFEDDTESSYSVESETERGLSSLRYLPLSLEEVEPPQGRPQVRLQEDALLDSGATHCAISIRKVLQHDLKIRETEQRFVRTAGVDQELPVEGRVRLNLRWKDEHGQRRDAQGRPFGTRIWAYVVYGLSHALVLSHDIMENHPEVWKIARVVGQATEQLNLTWFDNVDKAQQEAEREFREKRLKENKAKAEAERRQREAELDAKSGAVTTSPPTTSSATSISGASLGSGNS